MTRSMLDDRKIPQVSPHYVTSRSFSPISFSSIGNIVCGIVTPFSGVQPVIEYLSRSVEISGCPAYNKTRQNVASDTSDTCQHRHPTQSLVPQRSVYVRHSSIRRDILSDTKNLAGLVPRIRDEGFRKNDINIPSDVGRRKRGRKRRKREKDVDGRVDGIGDRQETGGN